MGIRCNHDLKHHSFHSDLGAASHEDEVAPTCMRPRVSKAGRYNDLARKSGRNGARCGGRSDRLSSTHIQALGADGSEILEGTRGHFLCRLPVGRWVYLTKLPVHLDRVTAVVNEVAGGV